MTAEEIEAEATDPEGMRARREAARSLHGSLESAARLVQVEGHLIGDGRVTGQSPMGNGDDRLVGIGYLCEIAASLQAGVIALVDAGNVYAAAALIRQIVEVEGLLWAFSTNHEDASTWLNATPEERHKMFMPKHIRARAQGRFADRDYWTHCENGGHPTPDGARLLFGPGRYPGEAMLCESILHTRASWGYTARLGRTSDDDGVPEALTRWRQRDRLAERLEQRTASGGGQP